MPDKKVAWKEYCNKCKKFHIVSMQACPDCEVYTTPQPVSDVVKEKHLYSHYRCDGCDAYQDHINQF